jgi:hypothetical protein
MELEACSVCQRIARAVVNAARLFGARVGGAHSPPERVCDDHLPLIVGFMAPRELSSWLVRSLEAIESDPSGFDRKICPLCEAEETARHSESGIPATGLTCGTHGGGRRSHAIVTRELERIAIGEKLPDDDERRILRAALVLYASIRGTSVFIPRIE